MPNTSTDYEAALAVASVANNAPLWQILPDQTPGVRAQSIGLLRLSVSLTSATPSTLALVAPATVGGAVAPILLASAATKVSTQNAGAAPAFGQIATAWGVAPTFAVAPSYYRVMTFVGVVGETVTWEWPEDTPFQSIHLFRPPIALGDSLGMCLRNITGAGCGNVIVNARWREFYPET